MSLDYVCNIVDWNIVSNIAVYYLPCMWSLYIHTYIHTYPVYRLLSLKQGLDVLVALFTTLLQVTLSNALSLFKLHEFKSSIMTSSQDLRGRPLPRFPLASRLRHWLIQPSEWLTCPNHLKRLDLNNVVSLLKFFRSLNFKIN